MLTSHGGFSGFSVKDIDEARAFYRQVLGLEVSGDGYGSFIEFANGGRVFFYPKGDEHQPASFTILNLEVDDIDVAVDELTQAGVVFEHYDYTDEKGIQRGIASQRGPDQAWFQDPSGNIISVLHNDAA